jgi:protein O-mannosyl-transferase
MSKSVASPLLLSASINNGRLLFWLGLLLTTIVYWPGLHGGYFFDDFPNIVENRAVQLTALAPAQLQDAALSSPSRELKRPLAMLSFALNHYFCCCICSMAVCCLEC